MKKKYLSLVIGLCLLAGPVVAQEVAVAPPLPTSFRGGSYLSVDADEWQPAKLRYTAEQELLVADADHKPSDPLVLPATQVRAFAIGRDTFDVVHALVLPKPAQQLPAAFARRLFRGGGYLVAEYVAYLPKPEPALAYRLLLPRPGGPVAGVLPPTPRQFRMALAAVVQDYQPLAQQLELDPNVLPVQLPELLAAYGHWKAAQPANATTK